MNRTVGVAPEDLFSDLLPSSCADAQEVFEALKELERLEAVLCARRAALVAKAAEEIAQRKIREEKAVGKGVFSFAIREAVVLELSPALGVSSRGAEEALSFAEDMTVNFPKLGAKLAAGEITAKTARYVVNSLGLAPTACREELDAWLAAQAPRWRAHTARKIERLMEAQYLRLDPEWCKKQREHARKQRGLFITPGSDGMADLRGTLPLEEAAEIKNVLDKIARTVCPHDGRPVWTRHRDALHAALVLHEDKLVCQCGRDTCEAAQRPAHHAKNIELVVQLPALVGKEELPALLDRAPIDSELARMLAKAAKRIAFTTTPENYVPTPSLATHVNTRDGHCRFPGCYRRARTELDHSNPFNHKNPRAGGKTTPDNIKRLCKHHHRAKTHGGWKDRQLPDGTIEWTSPTGQTYRTKPD